MDATRLKALWPAGLALGAALALALLVPSTPARRVTNLDLSASGFPDTYVMFSKSEADRVYLTNRRDSTLRRDDSASAVRNRDPPEPR